jgi:hypothetical protein
MTGSELRRFVGGPFPNLASAPHGAAQGPFPNLVAAPRRVRPATPTPDLAGGTVDPAEGSTAAPV